MTGIHIAHAGPSNLFGRQDMLSSRNRNGNQLITIGRTAIRHPIRTARLAIRAIISRVGQTAEMSLSPLKHMFGDPITRHRVAFAKRTAYDVRWQDIGTIGDIGWQMVSAARYGAM